MGKVIQGPWGNKAAKKEIPAATEAKYPWHLLSGPKDISPQKFEQEKQKLKSLAALVDASGGTLKLPNGWFWDPNKVTELLAQLPSEDLTDPPDSAA